MGNGFADSFESEFGLDEEEDSDVFEEVAQSFQDSEPEEASSNIMVEARKKLAKAAYYELIVKNGVVEDNGTPQAREVNAEAQKWAYGQMTILLGMESSDKKVPVVQSPFTENEVLALKKLAEKLLGMTKDEPAKPAIKLTQAPAEPLQPKLKKVASVQPKAPQKAPAPAPQAPPKPVKGEKKLPKVKVAEDGSVDYDRVPSNVHFTDTDGLVYQFKDNPHFDPDKPGSKPRAKVKVSTQVKGDGLNRLPFPDRHSMEAITMTQSSATVQAGAARGLKGISASSSMPNFE